MAKIDMGNPQINGPIALAGQFVEFKDGVAETEDADVLAQAKAAGLNVDDGGNSGDVEKAVLVESLVTEAKALGIDVKGTWGVPKLQTEIAKAKAALDPTKVSTN